MTTVAFVLILMLACLTVAALIAAVRPSGHGHDPGHDDDHGSGGDDGSDRIPRRPLIPPGAGEPTWWPQFERELADYVADSRRWREPASRSGHGTPSGSDVRPRNGLGVKRVIGDGDAGVSQALIAHCEGDIVFEFHPVANLTRTNVVPMHRVDSVEPHGASAARGMKIILGRLLSGPVPAVAVRIWLSSAVRRGRGAPTGTRQLSPSLTP